MNKTIIISLLLLTTVFSYSVENSTISTIERFECIENLPKEKFSKQHFSEITQALNHKDEMIRLVTYNMLFNLYDHNLDEENRWPERLPRIVDLIHEMRPDVISTQELYPVQFQELLGLIGDEFSFFPGQQSPEGESYGIFYRTDRFELLSSTMNDRLAMVELKDLKTDKVVRVFNTHMPFSKIEEREASALKIAEAIEPYAAQSAVVFTGDLNTFPSRLDLPGLPFYDGDYIHRILSKGSLTHSKQESLLGHFGPISTFTNSGTDVHPFQGTGTPGIFLDAIYVSKKLTVVSHAVEQGTVDGHFPSDHMPVLIDFLID